METNNPQQQLPIQNQPTQIPTSSGPNKILLILGVIVLILLFSTTAYYLGTKNNKQKQTQPIANNQNPSPTSSIIQVTPTPPPYYLTVLDIKQLDTTNWKTYKDTNKLWITFKYPPSMNVSKLTDTMLSIGNNSNPLNNSIYIKENKNSKQCDEDSHPNIIKNENITLATGYTWQRFEGVCKGNTLHSGKFVTYRLINLDMTVYIGSLGSGTDQIDILTNIANTYKPYEGGD